MFLKAEPHRTGTTSLAMVAAPQSLAQVVVGDLLVADVLLHDGVVVVRQDVDELVTGGVGLGGEVGGDLLDPPLLTHVVVPHQGLHGQEVDDPLVAALDADGELDDRRHGVEAVPDHLHGAVEVGADAVHLVDEADARDRVLVGLAPHRLGLGLDPGHGVEDRHGPVEDAQGPLHLDGEVHVAGGVDDVDPAVTPFAGRGGGGDGDAPLLLLDHPVHGGGALVDLTDLVVLAGVVEDPLGRRGLARVDVGHDPDVAGPGEGELSDGACVGHGAELSGRFWMGPAAAVAPGGRLVRYQR